MVILRQPIKIRQSKLIQCKQGKAGWLFLQLERGAVTKLNCLAYNEYKETVVDTVEKLGDEVHDRTLKVTHTIRDKVTHPYDTIDEARDNFDAIFNKQRVDRAKDKIETEASIVVGYKDQFLGAVKEAFGRMLKDEELKSAGHLQKRKGEAEVALQKALAEEKRFQKLRAQIVQVLMNREALLSQLSRQGGFDQCRSRMRHVEVRERPNVADLFLVAGARTSFSLKTYDIKPLLEDIRLRRTMKPMLYVEYKEKGLLRSIPLTKKDLKFKGARSTQLPELWASIHRSGLHKLRPVPRNFIHDRSAPRLDLFRGIHAADENRAQLMKDVQKEHHLIPLKDNGAGVKPRTQQKMTTKKKLDKGKEKLDTRKGGLEIRKGTELKHI